MAKLMNWHNFDAKLKEKKILLFSSLDIMRIFGVSKTAATFLIHRYAKKGFILRVKRGLYCFPDSIPPELYIANKLYEPSYISLEFALSYHRVIPETVYEITSVTTKSTRRFESQGKLYTYKRIKRDAFTGYFSKRQAGYNYLIATPEKAFVDYQYLRARLNKEPLRRFNKEKIDRNKAIQYAKLFGSDKLIRIVKTSLS